MSRIKNDTQLDDDELAASEALNAALDQDGAPLDARRKALLEASAQATMNPPRKPITTRLPEHDLARLKAKALALGIPYQTLLASIVHRYLEGTLVEKR